MAQYDADPRSDLQVGQEFQDDLKPGTELLGGQYVIEKYLNAGGFGITYLAKDSLERPVVIKECFPSAFCQRGGLALQVRSQGYEQKVQAIIDRFEEEARALAKFSHPNIVGVHQVFKQNRTAYMVLDYVSGKDLTELVDANDPVLTHTNISGLLTKLLKAVAFVHKHNMLHRDISPDNILVTSQGEPILIDFGAAKEQATGDTRALSTLRAVKDGYSPQEFYIAGSEQNPASDLYSLAATFYYVVTREVPADSQTRLAAIASDQPDPVVPLVKRATDLYDVAFCSALDKAMSVLLRDRVQNAEEWLAMMDTDSKVTPLQTHIRQVQARPEAPAAAAAVSAGPATKPQNPKSEGVIPRRPASRMTEPRTQRLPKDALVMPGAPEQKKKSPFGMALGAAGVLTIGAVGYLVLSGPQEPGPQQVEVTVAAPEQPKPLFDGQVSVEVVEREVAAAPEPAPTEVALAEAPQPAPPPVTAEAPEPAPQPEAVASSEPQDVAVEEPAVVAETGNTEEIAELEAALEALNSSDPFSFGPDAGRDREVSRVIPDETVTAEPVPAVATAPSATATGDFIELESVMTGWTVALPFTASASDPAAIGDVSGNAPVWMTEGSRILSVNDTEVGSIAEIADVVRADIGTPEDATVTVQLSVEDATTGTSVRRELEVPVVQQSVLLNGLRFNTRLVDGGWITTVADTGNLASTGLAAGDEIVALVSTNERIDGETTLRDIINRETAAGNSSFNFAVNRNGSMYVESFTYAGIAQ